MSKDKTKEISKETQEKLKKVGEFLKTSPLLKDQQGQLMGALHYVQTLFGYLPQEAMEYISEKLSIPTAHIYGMATFYNYFSLQPKAKYQIYLCKGTACYVAGGARTQERLKEELKIGIGETTQDGMFGVNITRCLGCCGLSPVMQVNEDIYVRMVPEKIPAILEKYRRQDKKYAKVKEAGIGAFEQPGQ
ncbi:MAG: NAD(P)H-dependent oxidoreductase subunit E [bacterium]|nr:NAD(P)H-dependent oxidoreductase subunit E [bacterium]